MNPELIEQVNKVLINWADLKDYHQLVKVVAEFAQAQIDETKDTYMAPWNRTPGDPRYKAKD